MRISRLSPCMSLIVGVIVFVLLHVVDDGFPALDLGPNRFRFPAEFPVNLEIGCREAAICEHVVEAALAESEDRADVVGRDARILRKMFEPLGFVRGFDVHSSASSG